MKRPVLVTIIGIVAMLGGVGQVAFGGVLLGLRNDAQFLADANMTTNKVTYIATALVAIGVLTVVFASGCSRAAGSPATSSASWRCSASARPSTPSPPSIPHTAHPPSATSSGR